MAEIIRKISEVQYARVLTRALLQNCSPHPQSDPQLRCRHPWQRGSRFGGSKIASSCPQPLPQE